MDKSWEEKMKRNFDWISIDNYECDDKAIPLFKAVTITSDTINKIKRKKIIIDNGDVKVITYGAFFEYEKGKYGFLSTNIGFYKNDDTIFATVLVNGKFINHRLPVPLTKEEIKIAAKNGLYCVEE